MDDARFDRLAAALAADPSRRGLLRLISGGSLLALFGRLGSDEAAAKKKGKKKCKGTKKKCGKKCIPKDDCCTSSECPQGEVCRNGGCSDCVAADDCPPSDTACEGPVCENGRCATAQLPAGSNCATNRFCTVSETCNANGVCQGGTPRDCGDGFACTVDSCDESSNACVHAADDNACATGNPCRIGRCDPDAVGSDQNGCVFENRTGGSVSCGTGACRRTVQECVNGEPQQCVPGTPSAEICDGIDNDCNGSIDEGATCPVDPPATCGRNGVCAGGNCQLYGPTTVCRPAMCTDFSTLRLAARCTGTGDCPPSQTQNCFPYRCNTVAAACMSGCGGEPDCVPTYFCDRGTCRPKKSTGQQCTRAAECQTQFCVDGICCNTSCTGVFQNCSSGQCQG